jgi:hypothetical protein
MTQQLGTSQRLDLDHTVIMRYFARSKGGGNQRASSAPVKAAIPRTPRKRRYVAKEATWISVPLGFICTFRFQISPVTVLTELAETSIHLVAQLPWVYLFPSGNASTIVANAACAPLLLNSRS